MARYALTSGTVQIAEGVTYDGSQSNRFARSFAILCPAGAGTVLFERSENGDAPSMTDAARVDFSVHNAVTYTCEPGVSLWASASAGTINVDVLRGGERF